MKYEYQLLGRLKQDCEYYLGASNRSKKHLWALDEALQIKTMRELYEMLPEKPQWITLEDIDRYEEKMILRPYDDIPVTGLLLSIVQVLRNAAIFFRSETILAREEGQPAPKDYLARCGDLFYQTYAKSAQKAGLSLNQVTFEALLNGQMPDAVLNCPYDELQDKWIFNPWRGWRETTAKERCWAVISDIIDREGPGTTKQIEYDELAANYGEKPNDPVWEEFITALESERESPAPRG